MVKTSHPNHRQLNIELKRLILDAEERIYSLQGMVNKVDVNYIKEAISSKAVVVDVFEYIDKTIEQFKLEGKNSSKESYETLKTKLKEYYPGSTLSFYTIDYKFLNEFYAHMIKTIKVNSTAVMFRNLRALYNKGINEGIIGLEFYPFRKFKIKTEKPAKKNLPAEVIKKIATVKLDPKYELARDIFMLSFYTMGMNLIDMYNLQKTDIIMNRLDYQRAKTHQPISMDIQPEAWAIINKYLNKKGKYLLNFYLTYTNYRNLNKRINTDLKTIAKGLGIQRNISFYFCRHSVASIGISIGINRDVIGKVLSHSSGSITDVYTSYDPAIIDKANRKIIDYILNLPDL